MTFGINRSRSLIHVEPGPKPVQVWGFRGPIMYGVDTARWRETHDLGYVHVSWTGISISATTAVVQVRDYEPPCRPRPLAYDSSGLEPRGSSLSTR